MAPHFSHSNLGWTVADYDNGEVRKYPELFGEGNDPQIARELDATAPGEEDPLSPRPLASNRLARDTPRKRKQKEEQEASPSKKAKKATKAKASPAKSPVTVDSSPLGLDPGM